MRHYIGVFIGTVAKYHLVTVSDTSVEEFFMYN